MKEDREVLEARRISDPAKAMQVFTASSPYPRVRQAILDNFGGEEELGRLFAATCMNPDMPLTTKARMMTDFIKMLQSDDHVTQGDDLFTAEDMVDQIKDIMAVEMRQMRDGIGNASDTGACPEISLSASQEEVRGIGALCADSVDEELSRIARQVAPANRRQPDWQNAGGGG